MFTKREIGLILSLISTYETKVEREFHLLNKANQDHEIEVCRELEEIRNKLKNLRGSL